MTVMELVRLFAEPLDTAVVLTDVDLERPGPTVLYVNPAFARMSGYARSELIGNSPRLLQGASTRRELTRLIARKLRAEGRFHGVLENYRSSGEAYLCELDVRALQGRDGQPLAFIAFEREVMRRRGRPSGNGVGRYTPVRLDPTGMGPLGLQPSIFGREVQLGFETVPDGHTRGASLPLHGPKMASLAASVEVLGVDGPDGRARHTAGVALAGLPE